MNAKKVTKTLLAMGLALGVFAGAAVASSGTVKATEPQPEQQVRSVYTNELIPASQAVWRPIAVMMPTDKSAQPSYGIGNAKVLYEIMEEGNISRQLAIIDNWQGLERIGNIRSCRDYYIHIATEWDPILIHFGGVCYMQDRITAPDINNLSGTYEYGVGGEAPGSGKFYRTSDRKAPHNAYISAEGIISASEKLGYSLSTRPEYYNTTHFNFANGVNTLEQYPGAIPGNVIDLSDVFSYTKSYFTYNPETGLYSKSIHGKAQTDGLTGEQLTFSNVIIQNTNWAKRDAKGYLAFQTNDSTMDGYYFTKGRGIHITWKKTSDHEPTRYYDDNGNEIQINEGKTYIAIAQAGKSVKYS
ncbi:MAG: DUF3048 domain-containing protein [Lachnospiraceae bacterium]|nr:DUF3048 domain-containing protein [Lachnospiraceae bacterium]